MWSVLLSMSLLALSPTPTLWQFDGKLAFQAQRWIQSHYGETLTNHLLDEAALRAYLESEERRADLADSKGLEHCLIEVANDSQNKKESRCDIDQLLVEQVKLNKRVFLTTDVEGSSFYITLVIDPIGGEPLVYTATGSDLKSAGRAIIERAFGMGTYVITGIPSEARVLVDNIEVGRGPGTYVVTAQEHRLKVSAKNYQSYESTFTLKAGQKIKQELTLVSSLASLKIKIHHEDELEELMVYEGFGM